MIWEESSHDLGRAHMIWERAHMIWERANMIWGKS